jgi:succinate-semialdehyde dehydrogenase/glutarate-semialdehyde dehydrogenase
MKLRSVDPYRNELIAEYEVETPEAIEKVLDDVSTGFEDWSTLSIQSRSEILVNLAAKLRNSTDEFAETAAREMGKPISQGRAEIEKCAWVCEYYAEHAPPFLSERRAETDGSESYIRYEALGIILAVMPWNFPYWQVFRFLAPALMAGNAAILKHASNVQGCARLMERVVHEAGVPTNVFRNLTIPPSSVESLIADARVKGVSLTGGSLAGESVGALAGKYIKPSVLELGGNNAFIVLKDADMDVAVAHAVLGRFQNNGQSCIAAKRILIQSSCAQEFIRKYTAAVQALWVGDPLDDQCFIGPLARKDLAEALHEQVERSMDMGAKLVVGGRFQGAMYSPTILTHVCPGMPVFDQETFGPVATITEFESFDEAITLSNQSEFGLGVSVYGSDIELIRNKISEFQEGAVFINSIVKSDPRLPFGGIKNSGYGRELAAEGVRSFTNIKTVYIA